MAVESAVLQPASGEALEPILASALSQVDGRRVLVLLAAQTDPARPGTCRLQATLLPERPLAGPLRLIVRWPGGRRTARVAGSGQARLRLPAVALVALRAQPGVALSVRVERIEGERDALA